MYVYRKDRKSRLEKNMTDKGKARWKNEYDRDRKSERIMGMGGGRKRGREEAKKVP